MASNNAGRPYVLSGPSGVGKSSLIRKLMNDNPGVFGFTVSHTTRAPRPDEKHGVDYYFVQKPEMQAMIQRNEFIEHVTYGDCQYGTSRQAVRDVLERGRVCIIDVDIQGAKSVKHVCADMSPVCVFIKPPSFEELDRRLRTVCGPDDVVRRRLDMARAELAMYDSPEGKKLFDHCVTNDQVDRVCAELTKVMKPSIDWAASMKSKMPANQQSLQPSQPSTQPPVMITPPVVAPTPQQPPQPQPPRSSSPQPPPSPRAPSPQNAAAAMAPKQNVTFSPAPQQQQQQPPAVQQPQRPASPQPTAPQAPPPAVVVPPPSSNNNKNAPPKSPQPPPSPTPQSSAPPPPQLITPNTQKPATSPTMAPPPSPTPGAAPSSAVASGVNTSAVSTPAEPPKPEAPKLPPPKKLHTEPLPMRPPSGSGIRVPLPVNYDFPKTPIQPKASSVGEHGLKDTASHHQPAGTPNQAASANAQDASASATASGGVQPAASQKLPVPPPSGCCGATSKRSRAPSPNPQRQADISAAEKPKDANNPPPSA